MRLALAIAAFLLAVLCFGMIGGAFAIKVAKFKEPLVAFTAIVGTPSDIHWIDIGILAVCLTLGAVLLRVGAALLRPLD